MKIFKALIYQLYWKFYRRKEDDFDAKSRVWLAFSIYIALIIAIIFNICQYFHIINIMYKNVNTKLFIPVPIILTSLIVIPFLRGKKFETIKNNEDYDTDEYQQLADWLHFILLILFYITGYMWANREGLI